MLKDKRANLIFYHIADIPDLIDKPPFRIWYRPIHALKPRDDRASFTASHRHQQGCLLRELLGQKPRLACQNKADLKHDFFNSKVYGRGRLGA
ncbi:MAG: hypothetical protein EOO61_02460, partial [Hymenobacter sp.]